MSDQTVAERAKSKTKEASGTSIRDALRQAIIDEARPKSVEVQFFGQTIELRQPSLEVILETQDLASEDRTAAIVRMIISYAYVPGTDETVFTEHDTDIIKAMPFGPDMASINKAITDLTDIDMLGEEKNSEPTQED